MDILRQKRRAGFLCSNDALQCYDNIVHNIAMLSMRSRGAHPNALHSLFSTLQNAEHAVMTGYGVSEPQYGGRQRKAAGLTPIQGILQGNGMGPFVWAFISTILIGCMHTMGYTSYLQGAMTALVIRMMGYAFGDNTNLTITIRDNSTPASAFLNRFQQAVDCWEGVLRASGGGLEPTKTFWYLIDHKWTGSKWEYHSTLDTPGDITIQTPDGTARTTLERVEPGEARKTLGIYIAMDGNQQQQKEYLRDKGLEFADAYRVSHGLEKNDARGHVHYHEHLQIPSNGNHPVLRRMARSGETCFSGRLAQVRDF